MSQRSGPKGYDAMTLSNLLAEYDKLHKSKQRGDADKLIKVKALIDKKFAEIEKEKEEMDELREELEQLRCKGSQWPQDESVNIELQGYRKKLQVAEEELQNIKAQANAQLNLQAELKEARKHNKQLKEELNELKKQRKNFTPQEVKINIEEALQDLQQIVPPEKTKEGQARIDKIRKEAEMLLLWIEDLEEDRSLWREDCRDLRRKVQQCEEVETQIKNLKSAIETRLGQHGAHIKTALLEQRVEFDKVIKTVKAQITRGPRLTEMTPTTYSQVLQ